MFGWCDEAGASKIFWFEETKGGNQKLVRPDGSSKLMKQKNEYFEQMGNQALAGWQRARLLMAEYEIWDVTAFACTMDTLIGIQTNSYENGKPIVYIFSSCENAERKVYPVLSKEKVEVCRKNVDLFYSKPNLQAAWHDFILHPVCLRVIKETGEMIPVAIEDIGCGQGAMGRYRFIPGGSLECKEWIEELFEEITVF